MSVSLSRCVGLQQQTGGVVVAPLSVSRSAYKGGVTVAACRCVGGSLGK